MYIFLMAWMANKVLGGFNLDSLDYIYLHQPPPSRIPRISAGPASMLTVFMHIKAYKYSVHVVPLSICEQVVMHYSYRTALGYRLRSLDTGTYM